MATAKKAAKKVARKKAQKPEDSSSVLSATLYTTEGKAKGAIDLPVSVFGLPWNDALIHQVVTSMEANARTPVAHVKTRGEVRGGGRKPWQQKGTGRARHGSIRSPIWIGGGVTHGPRNDKVYAKKVNRKMRAKALMVALSRKFKDGELLLVDALQFSAPKAKEAKKMLGGLARIDGYAGIERSKNAVLFVTPSVDANVSKSFRNFGNIHVLDAATVNPVEVLRYKHVAIVAPEATLPTLEKRIQK